MGAFAPGNLGAYIGKLTLPVNAQDPLNRRSARASKGAQRRAPAHRPQDMLSYCECYKIAFRARQIPMMPGARWGDPRRHLFGIIIIHDTLEGTDAVAFNPKHQGVPGASLPQCQCQTIAAEPWPLAPSPQTGEVG